MGITCVGITSMGTTCLKHSMQFLMMSYTPPIMMAVTNEHAELCCFYNKLFWGLFWLVLAFFLWDFC